MQRLNNPPKNTWAMLSARPQLNASALNELVEEIFATVKAEGDQALLRYASRFEQARLSNLRVSEAEFEIATREIPVELQAAIQLAKTNIEKFHRAQVEEKVVVETAPGVCCWRESRAIEKVGLYIPGGSAPLFSTVLMLGIPAKIAGCRKVVLCTPPAADGSIHPAILYSAKLVGIEEVYKVGGAQAIAALTFGTETIPAVYKIFGPGNQYVTKAKEYAQQKGVAIDMPAGPSEVLVIADESCEVSFVAADLLSQAEHGSDSQVMLLSPSSKVLEEVMQEVEIQCAALPRKALAGAALNSSRALCLASMEECVEFSNYYAPEHLIIASTRAGKYVELVENAGSVFVGNFSCESAGDYASGTNHTLPTNGFARAYSGVSLDSFIRKITFQEISAEGIATIGPAIECMAEAEALFAHKNAVTLRLKKRSND